MKTGYLLGATPKRQQIGELIGVVTSAFFVAGAVYILGQTYGFGTEEIPAPQALLMKTVVEGVLSANLPWGLLFIGVFFAAIAEFIFKVPSLPFAVGMYLPVSTWTPILVGGIIKRKIEKKYHEEGKKSDTDPAILLSSGFIAGEGIIGVVIAAIAFITLKKSKGVGVNLSPTVSMIASWNRLWFTVPIPL